MKHRYEYRVMFTGLKGEREESPAFYSRPQAIKYAKELKEQGYKSIFVDVYGARVNFDGSKDYDDIVFLEDISI